MIPNWLRRLFSKTTPSSSVSHSCPGLPARWRRSILSLERLEPREAPATHLLDNVEFYTPDASFTANSTVQIGEQPSGNNTFVPLFKVTNGITFDDADHQFTTTGTATTVIGSTSIDLFDGTQTFSTLNLLSSVGDAVASGKSLTVAQTTFTLSTLELTPTDIKLQGSITLPQVTGLSVSVTGSDYVDINSSGVSLTGLNTSIANGTQFSVGGLTFSTQGANVAYTSANNTFTLTGGGSFSLSTSDGKSVSASVEFGDSTLGTTGLVVANGQLSSLNMAINGSVSVGAMSFASSAQGGLELTYSQANQVFDLTGGASFQVTSAQGGGTTSISANVAFGDSVLNTQGLVITDGSFTSLNMAIAGAVNVGPVQFTTTGTNGLEITYTPATDTFTLGGGASFSLTTSGMNTLTSSVDFGGTTASGMPTAGLVIVGGQLTNLDATASFTNATLAGATFNATNLHITYTAANSTTSTAEQFTVSGNATLAFGTGRTLQVHLGGGTTTGLVIRNDAIASLNATADLTAPIAGATLTATGLQVSYAAATGMTPEEFTASGTGTLVTADGKQTLTLTISNLTISGGTLTSLSGSASIAGASLDGATFSATLSSLSYAAASGNTPEQITASGTGSLVSANGQLTLTLTISNLVITGGDLTSLSGSASISNATVAGATLNATITNVSYSAASGNTPEQVTASGTGTLNFGSGRTLNLTIGSLVIEGGDLTSLSGSGSISNATVAGATLNATITSVSYTAASGNTPEQVTASGTGTLDFGSGRTLTLTIGSLVISGGALSSLSGSGSISNATVAGAILNATITNVSYSAASGNTPEEVTASGTGTLDFGSGRTLTLTIGSLVISGGALSSLSGNGSISNATVAGATLNATITNVSYTAASGNTPEQVTASGTGTLNFGSGRTLTLTIGSLVIADGALASISASGSISNATVAGATLNATITNVSYTAASGNTPEEVTASGTGTLNFGSGRTLTLTIGSLVISSGALQEITASGSITNASVSGVTLNATISTVQYIAASGSTPEEITASGTGTLATTTGQTFSFTLGDLIITGGTLTELDMSLTSNLTVGSVTFTTTGLGFQYTAANNQFTLSGAASTTVTGLGTLSVTFGHGSTPGLTISNGALTELDMTLNSNITVGSVLFTTTGLEFEYTTSPSEFILNGQATATVTGLGTLSVTFGHGTTPGLTISNGTLTELDMTLNSNITVGSVMFTTTGLEFEYTTSPSEFILNGQATATVTGLGTLSVTFGHGSTPGLTISNGVLTELDMTLNSNITVGSVMFTTTGLELEYTTSPSEFILNGQATATVSGLGSLSVTFGHGSTPGLTITNGALTELDMTLNSNITVGSVMFTTTGLEFEYTTSPSQFILNGQAMASVTGLGTLSVTFGHGSTPGLTITNGGLTELDMTLNSNLTVGSVMFTTSGLEFTYLAANQQFSLAGTATTTVTGLGTISVTFGHGVTPGLVVTSGALTDLDMTLKSNLTVGSVTFMTSGLEFQYVAATQIFSLAGTATATITGLGTVNVTFGHGPNPGLVITNDALTSLDMTLASNITVGSVTFTTQGLEFTYVSATSQFTLSGTATATIAGLGMISVTFGYVDNQNVSHPGLVITNDALTTLDMTLNSTITVGSLTFATNGLEFKYTAANNQFALTGTASVAINGIGTVMVQFGYVDSQNVSHPGLVITSGSLTSMDMTLESNISVASVTFTTTGLQFQYVAASGLFSLTGSASVAVTGIGNLGITFGHGSNPGLVISGGALTSLDMTVNSNIVIGAVTFNTTGLEFTYIAATSQFTLKGAASAAVKGIGSLGVNFGSGLVISNGQLTQFDLTLNGGLSVGGLTFNISNLQVTYASATQTFTITGASSITLKDFTLQVQLGDPILGTQGLVIQDGSLESFDMAVTGGFTVASLSIQANSLRVTYDSSSQTFTVEGGASFSLKGNQVSVDLGGGQTQGLVIQNGQLESFDMSVSANFHLFGLTIGANNLTVVYMPASGSQTSLFEMYGSLSITSGESGSKTFNALAADLGTVANPGIVISGGDLTQLNIGVSGSFNLFGLTIVPSALAIHYVGASSPLEVSGGVTVAFSNVIKVGVAFPNNGLTINLQTGAVSVQNLSFTASFTLGILQVKNLAVSFTTSSSGVVSVAASGEVDLPSGIDLGGKFDFVGGQLNDVGVYLMNGLRIPIGDTGFFITGAGGEIDNLIDPANLVVSINVDVTFGPKVNFLGGSYTLLEASGTITVSSSELVLTGTVQLLEGALGTGTATLTLHWATGIYSADVDVSLYDGIFQVQGDFTFTSTGDITLKATAELQIPDAIPLIGGKEIGGAGFYLQIRPNDPNKADSFAAGWFNIFIIGTRGIEYNFNKQLTLINGNDVAAFGVPSTPAPTVPPYTYTSQEFTLDNPSNVTSVSFTAQSSTFANPNIGGKFGSSPYDKVLVEEYNNAADLTNPTAVNNPNKVQLVYLTNFEGLNYLDANGNPVGTADPNAIVIPTDGDLTSRVVTISAPAGQTLKFSKYRIVFETGTSLASAPPTFSDTVFYKPPTIVLDDSTSDGPDIASIGLDDGTADYAPASPNATISYYYDRNDSGYQGTLIETVPIVNPSQSLVGGGINWDDFRSLAPNPYVAQSYYFYAVINDGTNPPVFSAYAPYALVPLNPVPIVNASNMLLPAASLGAHVPITITASSIEYLETTSVTISAQSGTWSVPANVAPNAQLSGDGRTVTITAPTNSLNTLLGELLYVSPTPNAGFPGYDILTVTATDTFITGAVRTYSSPTATVYVVPSGNADLAVTEQADNPKPIEGATVNLTVNVANNASGVGSQEATDVSVQEELPNGLTLVNAVPSVGTYNPATGIWTIGSLAPNQIVSLALQTTVNAGTGGFTLTSSATVTADQVNYIPTDAQGSINLNVKAPIMVTTTQDVTDATQYAASLTTQITQLQAQETPLQNQLAPSALQIAGLQAELVPLQTQISSLTTQQTTLNSQITSLTQQIASDQAAFAAKNLSGITYLVQYAQLEATILPLQSQETQDTQSLLVLQGQLSSAQSQVSLINANIAGTQALVAPLQTQLNSLTAEVASLQTALANHPYSLREAVTIANALGGTNLITFASGLGPVTVTGSSAIPVSSTLVFQGGTGGTTLALSNPASFTIQSGGTATFENVNFTIASPTGVTIQAGGSAEFDNDSFTGISAGGSVISNSGTLTIKSDTFHGFTTAGTGSALIGNFGTLTVTNTTFDGNQAHQAIVNGGMASITDSTFSNSTNTSLGQIYNFGSVTLLDSTLANDSSASGDAAITNVGTGTVAITDSTIANNTSTTAAIGNLGANGAVMISGSIVAGNSTTGSTGPDVNGVITSKGHNLIGASNGSSGWVGTDLTGTLAQPLNADLSSLQNNGGSTLTLLPMPGSPAVDAGSVSPTETTDQAGNPRVVGAAADIGAVEVQPGIATHFTLTNVPGTATLDTPIPVTVNALDAYNHAATSGTVSLAVLDISNDPPTNVTITFASGDHGSKTYTIAQPPEETFGIGVNTPDNPSAYTVVANVNVVTPYIYVFNQTDTMPGVVPDDPEDVSLRQAIEQANATYGQSIIGLFVPGNYNLTYGPLTINANVSILGNANVSLFGLSDADEESYYGDTPTTIDAGNASRDFIISQGSTVTLDHLLIEGGSADKGGAILNEGTLTITNSTLTANSAAVGGGAIWNDGTLSMAESTLTANTAPGGGDGGAIDNTGAVTLDHVTISGNTAGNLGGGIYSISATSLTLSNTILAGNSAGYGPDQFTDSLTSLGNNLIGNSLGVLYELQPSDLHDVSPNLGPLQDNGGFVPTMEPLPGSAAVGNGAATATESTDERDMPQIVGGGSDIGAVQTQPGPLTQYSFTAVPSYASAGMPFNLTVKASDTYNRALTAGTFLLSSTDPQASLPTSITFDGSGIAQQSFAVTFNTPGLQSITLTPMDPSLAPITLSSILVTGANGIHVTTLSDQPNRNDGTVSLREAVAIADASSTPTTIVFDVSGNLTLTNGPLAINGNTIISGPVGGGLTIVVSGRSNRIFNVAQGGALTLVNLTLGGSLSQGIFGTDGGGISNRGTLSLSNVTITNTLFSSEGGAIVNYGTLNLDHTTISSNQTNTLGGAISNEGGTVTIRDGSSLTNNQANSSGGALFVSGGTVNISGGAVVSSNTANSYGGAIAVYSATVSIDGTTLSGNHSSTGGAIAAVAGTTVILTNDTLSNDTSTQGGALDIEAGNTATVSNSTLANNSASGAYNGGSAGGAIYNAGTLSVAKSTFSGNNDTGHESYSPYSPVGAGGAIDNTGTLLVSQSTFASNTTDGIGGAIASSGQLRISAATVVGNTAGTGGGGIAVKSGLGLVGSTVVAGNTTTGGAGPDVSGNVTSQGYNLIGITNGSTGWQTSGAGSDLTGTLAAPLNAELGPLQNNGGPTQTMYPLAGSPVLKAGPSTSSESTDQRGLPRVIDGATDIGSVEDPAPTSTSNASSSSSSGPSGSSETPIVFTDSWTGANGGDWSDPANWSTGMVPGPNDDVQIDAPGTSLTITSAITVHSLTTNAVVHLLGGGSLTITDGGSDPGAGFIVDAGCTLTFAGGTYSLDSTSGISGDGTLLVASGATLTTEGTYSIGGLSDVAGTLVLNGGDGGDTSGNFLVEAGGTLNFSGGTFSLDSTSSISGAGTVNFDGATVTLAGGYYLTGDTTVSNGSADFSTGGVDTLPSLTLSGGTLTGSDTLFVTGLTTWTGGTMAGTGVTDAQGGLTLGSDFAAMTLDARTLINEGSAVFTGQDATLSLSDGATIQNIFGATWDFQNDDSLAAGAAATGLEAFDNSGSVLKSAGTGTSTIGVAFGNNGSVDVSSGTLNFADGDLGDSTGSFTVESGATLAFGGGIFALNSNLGITGAGNVTVSGDATVLVAGLYSVSGTTDVQSGTLILGPVSGGSFMVEAAGVLDFAGDPSVTTSVASVTGAGTVLVDGAAVVVAGTYSVSGITNVTGTLTLNGGDDGDTSGSFAVAATATLKFASGSYSLDALSSVTGAGTVDLSGATITIGGVYDVTGATLLSAGSANFVSGATDTLGSLTLTGGVLTGTDAVVVTGLTIWTGGTMSGTGSTDAQGGLNLGADNTTLVLDTRTLTNDGTAAFTGDNAILSLVGGATLVNSASGIWDFQNDNSIAAGAAATGTESFLNAGTVEKTAGVGVTSIGIGFQNTGILDVSSGTLDLTAGGSGTGGTFTSEAGAGLVFGGGTFSLDSTSVVQGGGTVQVNGASVSVAGVYSVSGGTDVDVGSLTLAGSDGGSSGTFSVESTGTLTFASGTFSLANGITNSGSVILSGANVTAASGYGGVGATDIQSGGLTLEGESSGAFTVEPLGSLVFSGTSFSLDPTSSVSGTGTVQMTGADFTFAGIYSFAGTTIVTNGDLNLEGGDGGSSGAFTAQADATLTFAGGTYAPSSLTATSNTSQVVVEAGAAITAAGISLASGAVVEIRSGMLTLDGSGGSSSGVLSVDSGGTLDFAAGTYVFDSASSITGGGTVEVGGATVTVGGVYSIAGTTDIESGSLRMNGGDGGDTSGTFTVAGGTLLFGGGSFTLDSGSTLGGAGNVTVTGGASVTVTGTYGITGLTDVQSGTLSLDGGDGNSVSSGNYTVEAPGTLIFGGGTFALNSSSITGTGNVEFTGGVSVNISQTYSVTGSTDVSNDSTLSLQGGDGGSSGSFTVESGSALAFAGGTFTFGTSAGISGAGNVTINGATVSFGGSYSLGGVTEIDSGSASFNAGSGVTLASLTLTGGTLMGTATLTVTGQTTWDGGTMAGTGVTDAKGGLEIQQVLGNDPLTLDARTLINEGTATVDGSSTNLCLEDGAAIENLASATWTFTDDNALSLGANATGTETFTNYGTLEKSGGLGITTLGTDLVNSGTVDVQTGTLSLQGSTGTSSGAFISETGATLDFGAGGFTETSTASVGGAGDVTVSGGIVAFGGSYTVSGATIIDGGSANFSTGQMVTLPTLTLSSGVLTGSDTVKVTGQTTWTGGLMGGSGTTDAVGGLDLGQDNASLALDTRTLINESAAVFTGAGATLNVTSGAIINNLAGASWSVQTSNSQASSTGGTFNNAGSVTIGSGAIFTIGTYTQTAGVTELDGGTLGDGTAIMIQAGTLRGSGTLGGNVTNSGILSPGSSSTAGELSIMGGYTQTAGGTLNAKIGGSTPGTNQDQLAVSGAAALNGTLNVSLLNGYQPNSGTAFQLVTFGSESGDFATRNGFNLGSGAAFVESLNHPVGTLTLTATFPQSITFSSLAPVTYATGLTVPLTATGGASGNAVTFRVVSGLGTISGNTLTVTGAGSIVIEADQAASSGYYAATPVQQTLVVNRAALTITASSQSKVYGQTLTFGSGSTLFTSNGLQNNDTIGSVTLAVSNNGGAATAAVGGSYTITPSAATGGTFLASNYNITYMTSTLTVSKANTNTSGTVSSSSPSLGQNVTLTATETAVAPGSGTPTGTVDFYDTTTASDLGSQGNPVSLTGGSAQLTTNHLALGANSITLTYSGDTNFIGSTKTVTVTVVVADYALSTTASGAVALSSSASINVPGVLEIDSSSSTALSVAGTASVTASSIQIVGKNKGYTNTGTGQISPTPTTGVASFTDPLAYLPTPSTSGLTNYGTVIDSTGSATLNPGIYNEILLEGTASATLNPGLYIIKGGGVIVEGNATITGSGVVFYNTSTNYPSTGGTYGSFLLTSNSTLSAPTSGTYDGVLLFQDRGNTKTVEIMNGTSNAHPTMNLTGTVYASTAPLVIGNVQVAVGLVASTLTLGGTAVEQLLADSDSGTVYSPAQITTAYGINALALDGTGQTIAIVDAYDDPAIYQSVDAFDMQFGVNADGSTLYQQAGPAASFLTVLNQNGQSTSLPATDPSGVGGDNWEVEEALDVEWTHAIAPGAQIVLVEANSQTLSDLMAATATAAVQPGVSVVSMSWGFPEGQAVFQSDEALYDGIFTTPGVTFVASTGDYGAADPEYPAFSPNVLAVGGTSLTLNGDNSYNSETGWGYNSASLGMFIGSGGGISQFEAEPSYQLGVQSTGYRTTPDVSLVADPATGAWIADQYNLSADNPWEAVGGTSLSTPIWAGLIALANQGRASAGEAVLNSPSPTDTQTALYNLPQSDYNVISSGDNGYSAASGYNLVTGLGTPIANLLVPDLIAWNGTPNPSGPTVAPIQSTGLINSGVVSVGGADVLNVFSVLTMASHGSNSTSDLTPDTGIPATTNHGMVLLAEVRPSSAATSNPWESAFSPAALSALKTEVDPGVQGSVLVPAGTFVSSDLVSGPSGERLNRNTSPSSGGPVQPLSSPALVVSVGTFSEPNAATVWSDGASSGTPRPDRFSAEASGSSFQEGSIWDSPSLLGEGDGSGSWALRLASCGSCDFMRDSRQEELGTASDASGLTLGLGAALLAVHLFPEPADEEARKHSRVGLPREKE